MTRLPVRSALITLVLAAAMPAAAQTVVMAARDTAAIAALPAATVTTAMRITNRSADHITIVPRIVVPAEWSVPMGALPFALGAGESDSWIVGVRVPARAPAGRYRIAIVATDSASHVIARDSITVEVSAVHGLDLALTNRPTYAVSGNTYRAAFLLQNRGNVPATVTVRGTSVLGGTVTLDVTHATIAAGASLPFAANVATRTKGQQAQDDVLELFVADKADSANTAVASANVTIVQEANASEPLHRVASQLRLRAADASAGVSPFEFIGAGALRDGSTEQLSYVLRGSPGAVSAFGDRDEYRAELRGTNYTARVGDGLYRASSLSSNGQQGFGAGLDVRDGALSAGAYAQRFRHELDAPMEGGVHASARAAGLFGAPEFTVSGVSRSGGTYAGQVYGTGVTMAPVENVSVELEVAESTGPLGNGGSASARVSGGDRVHYDLGHIGADARFSGPGRGSEHDYATVSARASDDLRFSASLGSHHSGGVVQGFLAPQSFVATTVDMTYASRFSLQYSSLTRTSNAETARFDESQRGLLARGEQTFGALRVWGGAGTGVATSSVATAHQYHELSLGASANIGMNAFSLYGETSNGMAISRGANGLVTVGGDGRVQVGPSTSLTFNGFQTVVSGGDRYSQLDAGVSQLLPKGSTVSLRVRLTGNAYDARGRQLAFVEYSMPLQMPVGRTRTAGRVRGRVVDQETGHGVAGTLVRLGPQAAITDDEGRVAFAGLPAGEYRLSLAQQATQTATVFTGDPTVRVDSARRTATNFALSVERAGIVTGSVRQMVLARTGMDDAPDSLADAGPLHDITLALVGVRATIFATTDGSGGYRFAEVPSGAYVLKIMSEAHSGTRWEPAEIEVSVKPAVTRQIAFRSVPRRRAVQMISGETNPARK